ncbi:MAG: ABC transporter substrate-binding protein [Anaerolineae bacterium]
MKARLLWLVTLIILSLVAVSCAAPTPETVVERVVETVVVEVTPVPLTKVNVCFSAASGTMSPAWYAFENGLFEKYGLDVNLTYIGSGSKAATAMIAGQVEFCQIAGSAVTNAVVAGEDLVMIGGLFNTYVYSLMVTPAIETADDLKGKAVAISRAGSSSDAAIRAALEGLGLVPDEEVAVLAVGGQAERVAAMETGAVVGTVVSVPETVEAKELGFVELLDMSTLGIPFQHTGIATTRSYIESNREVVVNFMKALTEAIALMKRDKEGTMAVMAEYMLLDVEDDAPSLTEAYDVLIQGYLPQAPYPTLEGIQTLLTKRVKKDPNAANFTPEDVADVSIVQELEDSGFIADLYK